MVESKDEHKKHLAAHFAPSRPLLRGPDFFDGSNFEKSQARLKLTEQYNVL
jgi:hypothetical protein